MSVQNSDIIEPFEDDRREVSCRVSHARKQRLLLVDCAPAIRRYGQTFRQMRSLSAETRVSGDVTSRFRGAADVFFFAVVRSLVYWRAGMPQPGCRNDTIYYLVSRRPGRECTVTDASPFIS